MTKSISKISMLALIAAASVSAANAQTITPYVGGNLQYIFANKESAKYKDSALSAFDSKYSYDAGAGLGLNGGVTINNMFRAELELSGQRADLKSNNNAGLGVLRTGKITSTALMVNGYYDYKNSTPFTPFVGAGIGGAKVKMSNPLVSDADTVFAYQLRTGVAYDIDKNNSVTLGYRYFATKDATFTDNDGDKFESKYNTNAIEVGYRYNF